MIAASWPLLFISFLVFFGVLGLCYLFVRHMFLADIPNDRSSHDKPVTRAGGVAMLSGWAVGVMGIFLFGDRNIVIDEAINLFILVLMAGGLGFIDDRYTLQPFIKFIGQGMLATGFVLLCGSVSVVPLPLLGQQSLGFFAIPLSIFWIVGMMNAYNFMDGANGLAACVGTLALLLIAILAVPAGLPFLVVMAFLLAVTISAFLPYNLLRGSIFMGDSGSQAISFSIAAFAILLSKGAEATISPLILPVMMLPFIVDVAFTLFHRWRRGQNILHAHREHVYQLLLRGALGKGTDFTHGEVCGLYVSVTALSAVCAMIMMQLSPGWQWSIPSLLTGLFGYAAHKTFIRAQAVGLLSAPSHFVATADDTHRMHSNNTENQPAE